MDYLLPLRGKRIELKKQINYEKTKPTYSYLHILLECL